MHTYGNIDAHSTGTHSHKMNCSTMHETIDKNFKPKKKSERKKSNKINKNEPKKIYEKI